MPAIERILRLFQPLKSYFLSIEKCPQILSKFFNDDTSELWLMFLHNQASIFENAIRNMEGDLKTANEISDSIDTLKFQCKERSNEKFIPLAIKNILNKLVDEGQINETWFETRVQNFYENCFQYLDKWSQQFENVKVFSWLLLKTCPKWENVQNSYKFISEKFTGIESYETTLFDELCYVKQYAKEQKINEWNLKKVNVDLRWVEIFKYFDEENIPFQNILKVVEYALCLPGTNAATERIFSLVNNYWTPEKTQLKVETLKSVLIVKTNFPNDCNEFYSMISRNDELLKQIHTEEKYST